MGFSQWNWVILQLVIYLEYVHFANIEYIIWISQAFRDFKCVNTLEVSTVSCQITSPQYIVSPAKKRVWNYYISLRFLIRKYEWTMIAVVLRQADGDISIFLLDILSHNFLDRFEYLNLQTAPMKYLVTSRIYRKNSARKVDAFKFTRADSFLFKKWKMFLTINEW